MSSDCGWRDAGPLRLRVLGGSFFPLNAEKAAGILLHRVCREEWARGTGIHPTVGQADSWVHLEGGRLLCECDSQQRHLTATAGQTLLLPRGFSYRLTVPPEHNATLVWISASGAVTRQWWKQSKPREIRCLPPVRLEELRQAIHYLVEHYADTSPTIRRLACHYFPLILRLMRMAPPERRPPPPVSRCHALLQERFLDFPDYQSLAAATGVQPDVLTRQYEAFYHEKPSAALRRLKLNLACEWLMKGELTLAEIAERLGYADAFTFSKAFKQHSGLPPRRWKVLAGGSQS